MNQTLSPSSSQLGTVAEHLAAIQLMMASNGRLSPYTPMVDGDGYDVMVLDRETGEAMPIQIKSWSKPITEESRATVQFDLRKAAYRPAGYVLAIHFDPDIMTVLRAWLIPMREPAPDPDPGAP